MLLTLSTTRAPATELGWVLGKHPDRTAAFELPWGRAIVTWPEASDERATCALVLDLDPVGLVRGSGPSAPGPLAAYVNDRPYVASSFLSVAIGRVFRSALSGKGERADLHALEWPLEIGLSAVPARGGERLLRRLFEPLGYTVEATQLDPALPTHLSVRLVTRRTVQDVLRHLTVLIPVLDDDKHYWVGPDEIDKLVARGEDWLADHPDRDTIVSRSLKRRPSLTRAALARLVPDQVVEEPDAERERPEEALERPMSLDELRRDAVATILRDRDVATVVDLGCGEGKLIQRLLRERALTRIVGVDASPVALERAGRRLRVEEWSERQKERTQLLFGSALYVDARLAGIDAVVCIEVIEHLDLDRLPLFEQVLFEHFRPKVVVVTTPNRLYNVRYGLEDGVWRHSDHRFEWSRAQFAAWVDGVVSRGGYRAELGWIGDVDPDLGGPTQSVVFEREAS